MLKRSELEFWTSTPKDVIKQVDQHYKFLHGSDNKEKKVTNKITSNGFSVSNRK